MINGAMLARYWKAVLTQPTMLRLYILGSGGTLVEVDGGGYSPKPMTFSDWIISEGVPSIAEGVVREYRFDGSKNFEVTGAYLTDASGEILWVEPLPDGPVKVGRRGDVLPVRPVMKLGPLS